jgi:uncharacterized protein (TIGR02611 family)
VIDRLRDNWTFLKQAPPGERFARYHRRRQQRRRHRWQRPLWLTAGAAVVVIGIILMPAPGPGLLIVAAGLALLAGESATIAGWLDRGERRLRRWLGRRKHS